MKSDFLIAVTQLAAERHLPREAVISAIEAALASAYRKDSLLAGQDISVSLNPANGEVRLYIHKTVVGKVADSQIEISLTEAKKYRKDAKVDDVIDLETPMQGTGRIAAQTAKQVVLQRLREAERELVFEEYAEKEGDAVTATVQRVDSRQVTLDRYAGLNPAPKVFQTNKYFKGGSGGNVEDEFIADLESSNQDGTILVTVTGSEYVVTYPDATHTLQTKSRGTTGASLIIESLLPNPVGPDVKLEEVTIRNDGTQSISLTSWTLRDASNRTMSLESLGSIAPGESKTVVRNGAAMSLNNKGDTITLVGPGNEPQDVFSYDSSSEGVRITRQ